MDPIKVFFLVFLILMVMRAPMYLCLLGSSRTLPPESARCP